VNYIVASFLPSYFRDTSGIALTFVLFTRLPILHTFTSAPQKILEDARFSKNKNFNDSFPAGLRKIAGKSVLRKCFADK
jgi:hypothetical protein